MMMSDNSNSNSNSNVIEEKDYVLLKDLKVELNEEDFNGSFSLCFWLFLTSPNSLPFTILHQMHPDTKCSASFLLLNEEKKPMLFPVHYSHKEAPWPDLPVRLGEVSSASSQTEFPMNKWVHVGCMVSPDFVRLHIGGEVVGEKMLSSLPTTGLSSDVSRRVSFPLIIGDGSGLHDYVHSMKVLPLTSDIKYDYAKDPPLQLYIDYSSASEIEEDNDGVWSIVGGKASCRRILSLDVALLDSFGQLVNKEMEVMATLVYADNKAPVEKTIDAEAPLLASYDGIEYASSDRPSKLMNGRASFKIKISQLSSKCDGRLFCIRFDIPRMGGFSFLEVLSRPIRCISRNRNSKPSALTWKKLLPGIHLPNGSQPPGLDDGVSEATPNIVREARPSPSSKRVKLGQEKPFHLIQDDFIWKRADQGRDFLAWPTSEKLQYNLRATRNSIFRWGLADDGLTHKSVCPDILDNHANGTCLEGRSENHESGDSVSSHSEDSEATNLVFGSTPNNRTPISDSVVFKYCLGGLSERSLLLKEIAISVRENELANFAEQVSLFSGCSHHRHQITIAKRLIEEGVKVWNLISENSRHVLWEILVAGVKEQFAKIASCSSRSLTHQDFELLRRIAGCQELVSQEHFEKLWCWLYPVALTLSQDCINATWESVTPKWIEGFITKEEAESSLQGTGNPHEPGTFVLRFPTSRSWPHPDAGNLVVTYVGSDNMIHHRLLSQDFILSSRIRGTTIKTLSEMLLEVPELSRLGRVVRSC